MEPELLANVDSVKEFWETHVNNEYYTDEERASDAYFSAIEERRYSWHYTSRNCSTRSRAAGLGCSRSVAA